MKLRFNTHPVVGPLEFYTKESDYAETTSPRSIVKQRGVEFDHFRTYQTGDDARMIDWRASARSEDLLVRVYSEDISLKILLMVDVSESMLYGTDSRAKIEFAIELAINLAYGTIAYGDSIGLMMFNDDVISTMPLACSETHFAEIVERLTDYSKFGGNANFENALNTIVKMHKGVHLVIMISDFLILGDNFYDEMHAILDRFDILGMMVYDKTDVYMDKTLSYLNIESPVGAGKGVIRTRGMMKRYNDANKKRIDELRTFLTVANKDLWMFNTEDDISKKLMRLLYERNSARK